MIILHISTQNVTKKTIKNKMLEIRITQKCPAVTALWTMFGDLFLENFMVKMQVTYIAKYKENALKSVFQECDNCYNNYKIIIFQMTFHMHRVSGDLTLHMWEQKT